MSVLVQNLPHQLGGFPPTPYTHTATSRDLDVAPGGNLIHILNASSIDDNQFGGHIHPYSNLGHLHTNTNKFPTKPRPMWGYHGCTVRLSGEVDGYVSFLEKLP